MQLKSGSAASKGGGASKMAFPVSDWERDNEIISNTNGKMPTPQ
ncbi:hypothetical protein [Nostoc sp.]